MVIEHVILSVHKGQTAAFEQAMDEAKHVLLSASGCHAVSLARGIETPTKYYMQVRWDSVDAHMAFAASEGINSFRAPIGQFFSERPQMEHFSLLF